MITGIIVIIAGTLLTSAGYWLGYRYAKEEHRIDLAVYDRINKKLSDALVAEHRKYRDPDYPTWPTGWGTLSPEQRGPHPSAYRPTKHL